MNTIKFNNFTRIKCFFFVVCLSLLIGVWGCNPSGPVTNPGQYHLEMVHNGLDRTYELHVPASYDGSNPIPLLFDLHPLVINGLTMDAMTNFRAISEVKGFIVVQPNGIDGAWNAGPKCCDPAYSAGYDDIGYIRALRDELVNLGFNIDLSNVFADGMSNGGYLAHAIACEDTELFTGISGIAASMPYPNVNDCQPTEPKPVLMISGGDDNIADREISFNRWVTLNNCTGSPATENFGVFTCTTYTNCDAGVETTHCVGAGVGHCWPGTAFAIYSCDQDLDASQYIWDFFERNSQ